MIYTQFCDTLDPSAVQVLIDLVKGTALDMPSAALSAINVESYVLGKLLLDSALAGVTSAAFLNDDAKLQGLLAHAKNPALALAAFDWKGILDVIIKLLPLIK